MVRPQFPREWYIYKMIYNIDGDRDGDFNLGVSVETDFLILHGLFLFKLIWNGYDNFKFRVKIEIFTKILSADVLKVGRNEYNWVHKLKKQLWTKTIYFKKCKITYRYEFPK